MDNLYETPDANSQSNNDDAPPPVNGEATMEEEATMEDDLLLDNFDLSTFLDEQFPVEIFNIDIPNIDSLAQPTGDQLSNSTGDQYYQHPGNEPVPEMQYAIGQNYPTPQAAVKPIAPCTDQMQAYAAPYNTLYGGYQYYTQPIGRDQYYTEPSGNYMMQNPIGGQYQTPNYVATSPLMQNQIGGQYYRQPASYVAPSAVMQNNPIGRDQYCTESSNYTAPSPMMQQSVMNQTQPAINTAPSTQMQPLLIGPAQDVTNEGCKRKETQAAGAESSSTTTVPKRGRGRPPIARTPQQLAQIRANNILIREHVLAFKQLVPQAATKTEPVSILRDAIELIESLQMQVQQLQVEKEQLLMNQGSGAMTSMQSTPLPELIHIPNQMWMESDPTMSWPNDSTGMMNQAAAVGMPPISSSQDFDFSFGTSDHFPNST